MSDKVELPKSKKDNQQHPDGSTADKELGRGNLLDVRIGQDELKNDKSPNQNFQLGCLVIFMVVGAGYGAYWGYQRWDIPGAVIGLVGGAIGGFLIVMTAGDF